MKNFFLLSLTHAMNTYLGLDPESKTRLHRLRGRAITIEFLPFHFAFQCLFTETEVKVVADQALQAETAIRGTPLQLLGVMLTEENRQRFFADDLTIEGNAELGQQVIELFDELQIDWEDFFSRLAGDVPAYHVGRLIRGANGFMQRLQKTLAQDISEYIHEEANLFPPNEAQQDFFTEIDTLRMDVDRIEARINHLKAFLLADEEPK